MAEDTVHRSISRWAVAQVEAAAVREAHQLACTLEVQLTSADREMWADRTATIMTLFRREVAVVLALLASRDREARVVQAAMG